MAPGHWIPVAVTTELVQPGDCSLDQAHSSLMAELAGPQEGGLRASGSSGSAGQWPHADCSMTTQEADSSALEHNSAPSGFCLVTYSPIASNISPRLDLVYTPQCLLTYKQSSEKSNVKIWRQCLWNIPTSLRGRRWQGIHPVACTSPCTLESQHYGDIALENNLDSVPGLFLTLMEPSVRLCGLQSSHPEFWES